MDLLVVGRRVRHFRKQRGLTLEELGGKVGLAVSQLSLLENGKREPKLSQLQSLSAELGVGIAELLEPEAPDERAALEIELERAQQGALYAALGLPRVPVGKSMSQEVLESLVGMHRELVRRANEAIATPEEARRANTELRVRQRQLDHHWPDLEQEALKLLAVVGHERGALTHHDVARMARHLGFEIIHVNDLPHSTRSVTDLASGRIYLPPASIPGGHGLRGLALQAMAHRVLGHREPSSYAEFLFQRLQINYFAGACLMPEPASVVFLTDRKKNRDLAIEDFRDAFGVTHEAAGMRFLNLATVHLGLPVHFLRVGDDGAIYKAYENDGLPIPVDVSGSVEGQLVPRGWAARAAFERTNRTTEFHQITDTPAGTFWCSTQTGSTSTTEEFSISVGVRFADSKWFRGRDTRVRADASKVAAAGGAHSAELESRWAGLAWPSAKVHAHILSPLPAGTFPGVDDQEVYEFLEAHSRQ
ncbi:MAG: family transcriptional regulator [Naasia sp.]|nr:family transcriptional regulator [Naasia sp.]